MHEPGADVAEGAAAVVEVRALASSGAGVADLPSGRVAFVHRTAPGDAARVRVERRHARWVEARLEELIRPAAERVGAPCPLYDRCGGCALQHLDYEAQLRWKGRFVADALGRIGHVEVEPPVVTPSPLRFGYRNRMTYTLRRLRGGRVVAGLHGLGRPAYVMDVRDECLLPEDPIRRAWTRVREGWGPGARLLPAGGSLRLTLRAAKGGTSLLVHGGATEWNASEIASAGALVAVWHQPQGAPSAHQVAGAVVEEHWGGETLPMSGAAFLQVNREAAELVRRYVVSSTGTGGRAVDAYCGVGVYGRALARAGWEVTGIELDLAACHVARHEAPEGLKIVQGAVEEHLADALPAEVVVLNPPRTGLHEAVPDLLNRHRVRRLVYVSCDPATLARDAARLGEAYDLVELRAFDLFPQTPHVETVARFHVRGGG